MTQEASMVFVHGAPETATVWDPLVAALGRDDVVRLSPPGFGAPIPPRFGCTVADYRDWLVRELESLGRPVHLVGHDWGGVHVLNVAMTRPDLLLSWVSDAIGVFDPDYVWHPLAGAIQGAGGERVLAERFSGTRTSRTLALLARGIPDGRVASDLAAGQGREMARAALVLYRSAAQPAMAELGRGLGRAAARPGLVVLAMEDPAGGTEQQRRRGAARAGADIAVLPALGHWWLVQDPRAGAAAMERFWRSKTCWTTRKRRWTWLTSPTSSSTGFSPRTRADRWSC